MIPGVTQHCYLRHLTYAMIQERTQAFAAGNEGIPTADAIRDQVRRILEIVVVSAYPGGSAHFFLRVQRAVSEWARSTVEGIQYRTGSFGKPESFDPRLDSTVRVAARQLRSKLDAYYVGEGSRDPILIRFRPGNYTPRIFLRPGGFEAEACASDCLLQLDHAAIVETDRTSVLALLEGLDKVGISTVDIYSSAEETMDACAGKHLDLLITGFSLAGQGAGPDLIRAFQKNRKRLRWL